MKTYIETDELYPFYYLSDCDIMTHEVYLSEEEIKFVTETLDNFWKVQQLLKDKTESLV